MALLIDRHKLDEPKVVRVRFVIVACFLWPWHLAAVYVGGSQRA